MNNYNNNPLPPSQSCPSFGLWLALSIIAIVYIVFANTAYMQGNYEKYESNFKTVKIALLIGVILGIIKIIFRLFFGMVSILFL